MRAKAVEFDVTFINLREKPDWFLEISPHGKVPVLRVDDQVLFESNAIAEYLDEVVSPRLHPENPIERAAKPGLDRLRADIRGRAQWRDVCNGGR